MWLMFDHQIASWYKIVYCMDANVVGVACCSHLHNICSLIMSCYLCISTPKLSLETYWTYSTQSINCLDLICVV